MPASGMASQEKTVLVVTCLGGTSSSHVSRAEIDRAPLGLEFGGLCA